MSWRSRRYFAAIMAALALWSAGADAAPVNILFAGNSFTNYYDLPDQVGALAASAGFAAPNIVNVSANSQSLTYHRFSTTTLSAIANGVGGRPWDFVVLQDLSNRPTNSSQGDPNGFRYDAAWLYNDVKQYNPAAKVVLYETWGYNVGYGWYPSIFANYADMQQQLHANYYDCALNYIPAHRTVGVSNDVVVAPVGDAWSENMASQNLWLYNTDYKHPNGSGSYLNSLVIFETIYGYNPVGLTYTGYADPASVPYLQNLAAQTYIDSLSGGNTPTTVFIPEPASLALLGAAAGLLAGRRPRARRSAA